MRFLLIVGQSLTWEVAAAATGGVKSSRDMFCGSEKVGKIQRFAGYSAHEEQKMESTVGQKIGRTDENVAHTRNARANRVKLCKQTMRKLRATKKRVQSRALW